MSAEVIEKLLTADEVAELLDIPTQHVWRMARRGEIPVVRIGPRRVRFRPAEVELWIQRRTTSAPRGTQ